MCAVCLGKCYFPTKWFTYCGQTQRSKRNRSGIWTVVSFPWVSQIQCIKCQEILANFIAVLFRCIKLCTFLPCNLCNLSSCVQKESLLQKDIAKTGKPAFLYNFMVTITVLTHSTGYEIHNPHFRPSLQVALPQDTMWSELLGFLHISPLAFFCNH